MAKSKGNRVKACTGCLYYSSRFKSDSRNPLCFGFTGSLPESDVIDLKIPETGDKQAKKIEEYKEKKNISDVKCACVGFSVYPEAEQSKRRDINSQGQEHPTCAYGFMFVLPDPDPHSQIQNKQDGNGLPQRQLPSRTNSSGEEFLISFFRNANLVANGIAKNMHRVGNQIKQGLDDALSPYRKRPK